MSYYLGSDVYDRSRDWVPFKRAREIARSLGLKSTKEWYEYCKSDKRPDGIPVSPDCKYKNEGWVNWGDWLGTKRIATNLKKFRSFKEGRKFAINLGLVSVREWTLYCKSITKPDDIPAAPAQAYDEWINWGDWLGTENMSPLNLSKSFLPFSEARKIIRQLSLKSKKEWREYCKSGKKPDNIPSSPNSAYKDKGWKNMGDWLGNGTGKNRAWSPFKEGRKFAINLGLKSQKEWREYCKSGKKPDNIPSSPDSAYKDKGWKNMGDWLGIKRIATRLRTYHSFEKVRAFAHPLKLKTMNDWDNYFKLNELPEGIPRDPYKVYRYKGWKGKNDFLGTGMVSNFDKEFLPFEGGRKIIRQLNLKRCNDWREYCRSGRRPHNIPSNPDKAYKDNGWINMVDWLGIEK